MYLSLFTFIFRQKEGEAINLHTLIQRVINTNLSRAAGRGPSLPVWPIIREMIFFFQAALHLSGTGGRRASYLSVAHYRNNRYQSTTFCMLVILTVFCQRGCAESEVCLSPGT